MLRRGLWTVAIAALLALLLAGPAEARTRWDYSVFVGITHPIGQYAQAFADEVKKCTNGELEIVVRPAGELPYRATEMARVVGDGSFQLGDAYQGFIAGDVKIGAVSGLPYLVRTASEFEKVMPVLTPYVERELERFGATILHWYTWPPQNVWGRGAPIRSVADFKGRRIRGTSPEQTEMLRRMGASPVTFTTAELPAAAHRGVMDGWLTAGFNVLGAKWYEFTQWAYAPDIHIGGPSYILVNRKALAALPANLRETLQAVAREHQARMLQEIPAREAADRKTLETEHKITIHRPSEADVAEALRIMEPYWESWAKERGTEAVEALGKIRRLLDR